MAPQHGERNLCGTQSRSRGQQALPDLKVRPGHSHVATHDELWPSGTQHIIEDGCILLNKYRVRAEWQRGAGKDAATFAGHKGRGDNTASHAFRRYGPRSGPFPCADGVAVHCRKICPGLAAQRHDIVCKPATGTMGYGQLFGGPPSGQSQQPGLCLRDW